SWRRALSRGQDIEPALWKDLKYEIVVGCLDTGDDRIIHREVLDTTYTVQHLAPRTRYVVSVRACDEREQWGLWSSVQFTTLAALSGKVDEIGEDYCRLVWRRNDDENSLNSVTASDTFVLKYCLFVYSDDNPQGPHHPAECGYPKGGASQIQLVEQV